MLIEHVIARWPSMLRLLSAVDGFRGVEMAREALPDVILMDINLPGISGFEALQRVRQDPATAHIPVVAVSASAMPREITRGREAGFFRYLTKPIKVDVLTDTLEAALKMAKAARSDRLAG